MNMLDMSLRCEPKLEKFKTGLREWVKCNIAIKATTKFPALGRGRRPRAPPVPPATRLRTEPARNPITNYFQPENRN